MKAYSMQNKKAWEYNAYEFWVKQAGTPADRAKKRGPAALPWVIVCCGMMLTGCGEAGTEADGKSNDQVPENVSEPEETEPVQAQEDIDETSAELTFYQKAEAFDIEEAEAARCYERLCADNVFEDGTGVLSSLWIEDLDGNGQKDMVVMVQTGELYLYGEGTIYFYMNEDEAYRFEDCAFPFFYELNVTAGDFDNDGNTEIVFEAPGTGCGGPGDWHLRMLKYRDQSMERMEFPSETYEDDDRRIYIEITQESQADMYSAYCPYLDETIAFEAENIFEPGETRIVGNNVGGYCKAYGTEYEGRDALVVSEYLCGEGGNVHCVGIARFLLLWEQDGSGRIEKWWIEE